MAAILTEMGATIPGALVHLEWNGSTTRETRQEAIGISQASGKTVSPAKGRQGTMCVIEVEYSIDEANQMQTAKPVDSQSWCESPTMIENHEARHDHPVWCAACARGGEHAQGLGREAGGRSMLTVRDRRPIMIFAHPVLSKGRSHQWEDSGVC